MRRTIILIVCHREGLKTKAAGDVSLRAPRCGLSLLCVQTPAAFELNPLWTWNLTLHVQWDPACQSWGDWWDVTEPTAFYSVVFDLRDNNCVFSVFWVTFNLRGFAVELSLKEKPKMSLILNKFCFLEGFPLLFLSLFEESNVSPGLGGEMCPGCFWSCVNSSKSSEQFQDSRLRRQTQIKHRLLSLICSSFF